MRKPKGKRERIEKGSREDREKRKQQKGMRRQFEGEEGLKETISHGQVTQGSHKYIHDGHSYNFCKAQV